MSRAKSAITGSLSSQVFIVVIMFLNLITTPLILKYLNKEEYGLSSILFQIIAYFSMFDFGLGSAIARFLAGNREDSPQGRLAMNQVITTGFFTFLVLGLLVIGFAFWFAPLLPDLFKMHQSLHEVSVSIIRALGAFVGVQFSLRVFNSIFYAHQKQLLSNLTNFLAGLLNLILPVLFLFLGHGLWSFVYAYVLSTFCSIGITIWLIRKYYPNLRIKRDYFDKGLLLNLFGFGFFVFLNGIAVQVVFYTDRFLIGALVSLTVVSMFMITVKVPEICRDLIFKIADNTFPAMVEINTQEGRGKFKIIHQKLLMVTTCLLIIAFWIILIFNAHFVRLWVGQTFFAGFPVLVLALILMVQHGILHVSAICLNGAGLVKGFSLISIVEAVLNLALSILLGREMGLNGILLATILAGCLSSGWFIPYTAIRFLNIDAGDYFLKGIILPGSVISFFGLGLYIINHFIFNSITVNWLWLMFFSVFYSLLLFALTWKIFLKSEFLEYIPLKYQKYFLY